MGRYRVKLLFDLCVWQSCLDGLLKEGGHEKSPKCLGGNLGDFGGFWGILQKSLFIKENSISMVSWY